MPPLVKSRYLQFAVVVAATTAFATPAYAYVDPGTGSILLQSLLASVAVTIGFLRLYWQRLRSFFTSRTGSSRKIARDDTTDTAQESEAGKSP